MHIIIGLISLATKERNWGGAGETRTRASSSVFIITRKEGRKGELELPAAVAEVGKVTRAKAPALAPAVRVGVLAVGIEADLGGRGGGGVGGGRRHPQSHGIRYDYHPQGCRRGK